MRALLRLEFDGSPFCGWQMQAEEAEARDRPSIQSTVEKAISIALRRRERRFTVQGCGRTDAGVHAEEYFCHVDIPEDEGGAKLELEKFRHSLNALLPPQVSVLKAYAVEADFHALEDVEAKTYEYRMLLRRAKPALLEGRVLWLPIDPASAEAFDSSAFDAAVKAFEGEHDFAPFASVHGTAKTSVRRITRAEVVREALGSDPAAGLLLRVRFEGTGFLKQQVRTMAGTALDAAEGKRSLASIRGLLSEGGLRTEAGPCLPGPALFLTRVNYGRKMPQ
jgi:tRNA pseudouridine38-40 synthase